MRSPSRRALFFCSTTRWPLGARSTLNDLNGQLSKFFRREYDQAKGLLAVPVEIGVVMIVIECLRFWERSVPQAPRPPAPAMYRPPYVAWEQPVRLSNPIFTCHVPPKNLTEGYGLITLSGVNAIFLSAPTPTSRRPLVFAICEA